ncbi:MAG: dihydroorotate dehydrogenase electron transfer subunit, partial [Candidatus Dormibacteraeota bacterium]|nr:dihydroorotate dehydrogenase electron transfer subunit [Candidatus Dormibacteraeota bacterium]
MSAILERGMVTQREEVTPGTWLLRLRSPRIATAGLPGQFVHIRCGGGSDPLLRRPFSFADIDRQAGTYDILFNVVGQGTAILAAAEAGQAFEALGPLGHGFTLPPRGTLLMIAGGLGVAPFPLLARVARERGLKMRWLNGAYTAHQLLPLELLPEGVESHQCTDDGTAGEEGLVTALSERLLDGVAAVHACGPTPMLIALARQWQRLADAGRKLPRCEVSLEAPMGCALGTCLGCVVPAAAGGYDRVCVEGAVFDWRALDWPRYAASGE